MAMKIYIVATIIGGAAVPGLSENKPRAYFRKTAQIFEES